MHVIAAKAVCFGEALNPGYANYAAQIVSNAQAMARELSESGLRLVSGGTDNHLILVDLTPMGIDGRDAEAVMGKVGISANKNAIPNDPKPPRVASGLRLGTPAITSRGFKEEDVRSVSKLITKALANIDNEEVLQQVKNDVEELTSKFPVPGLDL
jgi:glycine hydroxymethyltransferase